MYYKNINNIVYPVCSLKSGHIDKILGTSFIIRKNLLATAYHITEYNDENLYIIINNFKSIQEYQDTTNNRFQCIKVNIKEINPILDITILEIENDFINNNIMNLDYHDNIKVGGRVNIFGYHHSDHNRLVLTQQNTIIGAKTLVYSSKIKIKNIVLNIQSRPGQSGSPIIDENNSHSIIGMLIGSYAPQSSGSISLGGIDPQTLHQTTNAIPAEYINEMIL